MLDLINCGEGINEYGEVTRAHQTDFVDNLAVTRANKSYKKGEQVFENYAQPNYIYWAYHGFALDENSHDCAIIQMTINTEITATMSAEERKVYDSIVESRLVENGFSSLNPTFCIRDDMTVLNSVANYFRVRENMPGDNQGLQKDAAALVRDEFKYRLGRYEAIGDRFGDDSSADALPYPLQAMKKIIEAEKDVIARVHRSILKSPMFEI